MKHIEIARQESKPKIPDPVAARVENLPGGFLGRVKEAGDFLTRSERPRPDIRYKVLSKRDSFVLVAF